MGLILALNWHHHHWFVLFLVVWHVVALTAARWWMRPLLLRFDRHFNLTPCKAKDFYFFCWGWPPVLVLMALYPVWHVLHTICQSVCHRVKSKILHESA